MKVFKRIAIMAIILMLCTTVNVYAGTTEAKLTASSNDVKVGDIVTITLSAYRGNGVEGFDATLKYDKTKLKLTNESQIATGGYTSLSGTDESTGDFKLSLMYGNSGDSPTQADIAQLKFEVLSGAKVNDVLNIKLTDVIVMDPDVNQTELDDVEINIKVVEKSTNTGGGNTTTGGNNTTTGGNNTTSGGNSSTSGKNNTAGAGNKPVDYPKAGIGNFMFVILVAVVIAGIIYVKINKYRDI